MNCPDIDTLLSDPAAWSAHASTCPECRAVVRSSQAVVEALVPPVAADPALAARTVRAVRRAAEADRERSLAGVVATFVLALLTLGPIGLSAYAAGGAGVGRLVAVVVGVFVASGLATAIEPRFLEG